MNYRKLFSRKQTPQSQAIPGSNQVPNSSGGFAWAVDDWVRLERFLILGSEGGSYYASVEKLTRENADAVERCIVADGVRAVACIVAISDAGRAPKNEPALFALAMAAKLGDFETRRAALSALPKVARTGTHLMHFADYVQAFGGWGRGTRGAVQRWFNDKPVQSLAYQVVKYQSRDGWSLRDLLRLGHPKAPTPAHDALYRWVVRGELAEAVPSGLELVAAFESAKRATDAREIVRLVEQHDLPRECVPTGWLNDARVWEALLEKMPMTAMIRNLATMTRLGLLEPMSSATRKVIAVLRDAEKLAKARIHPIAVLAAMKTYAAGRGVRGQHTWTPVAAIVDALDDAFYATFKLVEPSGARTLLALDVSGSMDSGVVAGVPGLTPRMASAAMALVTAATEQQHAFVAFTAAAGGYGGQWGGGAPSLTELDISPKWRLDRAVKRVSGLPFGGTDCAQPMLWALERRIEVDTFVIYTDSETWAGSIHPAQALREYRQRTGINAKLVVVGMVSNGFSIADPNDAGMLDVVGFDTATPSVISDFGRAAVATR
ncbi:MAG: TROVE domain-containing protein [Gaiellaceae bacterium]